MRETVIMHLKNVAINVFASNVIKIKVIMIYQSVLSVEHYKILFFSTKYKYTILSKIPNTSSLFKILSQKREYVQTQCNNRDNLFHFACRKWYLYQNSIFTPIQIQILV